MVKMIRRGITRLVAEEAVPKYHGMGYAVQAEPVAPTLPEKPAETEESSAPVKTKPPKKA